MMPPAVPATVPSAIPPAMSPAKSILALNAGSSSLKFGLYPLRDGQAQPACLTGMIEGLQPGGTPRLVLEQAGKPSPDPLPPDAAQAAADPFELALAALQQVVQQAGQQIVALAHRVVHGGAQFRAPVLVDDAVLLALSQLAHLAPLHQPHNLQGIRQMRTAWPNLPHIACFDTAFHATLPEIEYRFALPEALLQQGIRRYGFHGLSYQYLRQTLYQVSPRAGGRVLLAHLGNGASLCAMQDGQSIATSMGFSALDGLIMGSRSGTLDPGVLLYLLELGWDKAQLQDLLYRQSGLLGISGLSADMRTLRQSDAPAARLALAMFEQRLVRESGAMVALMEGVDVLVFSAGIGEHDALLRQTLCQRLGFLGVRLDQEKNRAHESQSGHEAKLTGTGAVDLTATGSAVEVWVIATDEGKVAAQAAADLLPPIN
jgi:acetate kinase